MPEDLPTAICAEEGCSQPVTGERPSTREYVLEYKNGENLILPPGEADEFVCADHMVVKDA